MHACLILEWASVAYAIRKAFYGYHKRLDEAGLSSSKRIRRDRIEAITVLLVLTLGIILQIAAPYMHPASY